MADVWRDKLMLPYSRFFSPSGTPSVGEGWADILETALRRIAAVMSNEQTSAVFRIVQTKEKFGMIRIYYEARSLSSAATKSIKEAIELAEARSACTCEICGKEGRLYDGSGWQTTRCHSHADGDPVSAGPYQANVQIAITSHAGGVRIDSCRRYDRKRDVFVDAPLPDNWSDD